MFSLKTIQKTYRNFTLETPPLTFSDHGLVVLMGDNGAGKSTLLNILAGRLREDRTSKGNARLRGAKWRESVFYLSETTSFSGKLYEIAESFSALYPKFDFAEFDAAFAAFGLSGKKKYRELSDGMKAKFKIAIAFAVNADVYFLDEVTNGMDLKSRAAAYSRIETLAKTKLVFFSTHIFDWGFEDYDRAILMEDGRFAFDVLKGQCLVERENRFKEIPESELSDGETPIHPVEAYRRRYAVNTEDTQNG